MAGNPFTIRWDTECRVCDGALWEGEEARWSSEHDGPVHPQCHEDADTLCANCDEPIIGELAEHDADGEPVHRNCPTNEPEPVVHDINDSDQYDTVRRTTAMTTPMNTPPWMTGGTAPAAPPAAPAPAAPSAPAGLPPWMTGATAPAPDPNDYSPTIQDAPLSGPSLGIRLDSAPTDRPLREACNRCIESHPGELWVQDWDGLWNWQCRSMAIATASERDQYLAELGEEPTAVVAHDEPSHAADYAATVDPSTLAVVNGDTTPRCVCGRAWEEPHRPGCPVVADLGPTPAAPGGGAEETDVAAQVDPDTATPATLPGADWEPDLRVGVTFQTENGDAAGELGVVELSGRKLFGVVENGQLTHMSYSADQWHNGWMDMLDDAVKYGGWTFLAASGSGNPFIRVSVAELREALVALRLVPKRLTDAVTVPASQAAKMSAAGVTPPEPFSTRIFRSVTGTGPSQAEQAASVQAAVEGVRAAMGVSFKANPATPEPDETQHVSPAQVEAPPFDADPTAVDMSGAVSAWNAYVAAKAAESAAKDAAKDARQMLDDYYAGMVEAHPELASLERWEINGVVVAKYADVESERFDVKAYREAHPRMAKKWLKTSTTKRLDVL